MTYPPCILIHNPLPFQLAFHKDGIITKIIKLSCVSFAPYSRIFLVVIHRFPQPERQSEIEQRLYTV